jgi:glycosyltransferase involved in cell wall biosynthesis
MNQLTILYIYRNRDAKRVKLSLESLLNQTNKDFKVLFIDYGSDENHRKEIQVLISAYSFCKYIYNFTAGMPWNRAHALNTGICICETNFVFTADIDMIFKKTFIAKLVDVAAENEVTFFSVYYLPKNFSDLNSLENKEFEKSKDYALGLALLPVETVKKIGGYDEFYCFWGMEDNDMENRLKKAGIKTKFYGSEVLMYHQWHESSVSSQKDFPEGWAVFQNDYFKLKSDIIQRNENAEWGKLFSDAERPSLKKRNNPSEVFTIFDCSASFFMYKLLKHFNNMKPGETLLWEFKDSNSPTHLNSRLGKGICSIQRFLDLLNLPMEIISKHRHLYSTVYDVRDSVVIFILANKKYIFDYSILINDKKLQLMIFKK